MAFRGYPRRHLKSSKLLFLPLSHVMMGQRTQGEFVAKIYTRRGDQGTSSLFGGDPVPKSDPRLEAYGTLDELNSILGLIRAEPTLTQIDFAKLDADLKACQNYLFTIGSHLAVGDEAMRAHLPRLKDEEVVRLESRIDQMEESLSPLKNFILPGGHRLSALLHLARTICRRAERSTVALGPSTDGKIIVFLNRLSDFLFVAARYANQRLSVSDVPWEKDPS